VKSLFLGWALWLFPGAYACFCVPSPPVWLLQGLQRRDGPAAEVGTWRQAFFAMQQPLVPVQMQIHSCFGMVSIPPPTSTRFLLMIFWIVGGILSCLRITASLEKRAKIRIKPTHPPAILWCKTPKLPTQIYLTSQQKMWLSGCTIIAAHHTWLQPPLNCHALVAIYLFYAIGLLAIRLFGISHS
jgi:hypothetical protein